MVVVKKLPFFKLLFFGNVGQENVFYDILERQNAFLGHKNKKFKKSKNWHISKGVNPWVWSKNGHLSNFFSLRNIDHENVFYDIPKREHAFLSYKIDIFPKWLTHGFGPKLAIFSTFFFTQYRPGKSILWYFRTKKRLVRLKKQEVEKVEKLTFFQRG